MQTILHLTDIHFGWEGDSASELAERKVCLDGLLGELKKLEPPWKPTIVCLTGDIGWRGVEADYTAAKEWLDQMLCICGLGYESLLVCAGNHDVVRATAKKLPRPESATEADEVLAAPVAAHFESPFAPFVSFCRAAGFPALQFGNTNSFLVGERTVNALRFVVLNSAWFCKGEDDKGKLWMGLPHMTFMEAHGQMMLLPAEGDRMTVALIHHPRDWLHEAEIHAFPPRPNAMDYLANRCHLILTGHTHGEVRGADRIGDRALHFTGGSAYAGASHFNSFRLLQITSDSIIDRAFEFNPGSPEQKWKSSDARSRPLTHNRHVEPTVGVSIASFNTADIRVFCRMEAKRLLELKSRLLKQNGPLPAMVHSPVSVRISAQRDSFDGTGRLVRLKDAEQTMPLYEAVRHARRTLLLGDLGTGKSTLAAQLVIDTLDRSETAVAVLLPVKALRLTGRFTRRDLLDSVANYIKDEVWLASSAFTLEEILNQQIEVSLVFDGLDELARDLAGRLLSEAAAIVANWPNVQVVATARPIELVGASYSDWRVIHTVALDDAAKSEFLRQELIADGVPAEQIKEKVTALLRLLKETTALDSIANSPLAIRLIQPRLNTFTSNSDITLGDLLYDVLMERLGGWGKRDDKPSAFLHLDEVLPTAEAKGEYLSVLARRAATGKRLQCDEAKSLLYDAGSGIAGANPHLLAEEALSCFEWLGLVSVSETVDFPLQPLAEVCAATGLVAQCHSNPHDVSLQDRPAWRIISFVGAIARRRGLMEELRNTLSASIAFLLRDADYVPAACYIVVESADVGLAESTIRLIDDIEYRPLRYFRDERRASARNIAKTLVLAGEIGFNWFYSDYLDARYPVPNAGSAVIGDVFAEWAALVRAHLTPEQTEKLARMVEPYRATGEGHFHGVLTVLSILTPDAFAPDERILLQSFAMDKALFADWAERQFRCAWDDAALGPIVDRVLVGRCDDSLAAARLWLERNQSANPPYGITRLAMRAVTRGEHSPNADAIVNQCQGRLGEEQWVRFARWFLISGDSAVGAAKVLFDRGERRLTVLGDVAMAAMHDGRYVAEAERILGELIRYWGETGVRWLTHRIANADEWHGGHSGWWRVLLPLIDGVDDGPHLLAICTRNLGQFTLPRYPEVREAFARVLKGSRGAEFRDALRTRLKSLDPQSRRGAALILISSDPSGETDALFVGVRSRAHRHSFDWHEWESFLLTLEFGPSVLSSLKGKLGLLEPQSRALALVLLDKGGFELDSSQRAELMTTLSSLGSWHLSREPAGLAVLGAKTSYERLKEHLQSPGSELAERAAGRLLEFHPERLTALDRAKCIALRHAGTSSTWELAGNLKRIAREPDFARDLIAACDEIAVDGGRRPLLGIAAKAISEQTGWKDVLWRLLCDDTSFGRSSESEGAGMALLEFGFEVETHRQLIGEAAKICLADPRFKQNRWHEAYHWVALLADEFGGLDKETIREVIVHGKPIGYSATTALIARLAYVPENFSSEKARRSAIPTTTQVPSREVATVVQELKDFGRDSNELHPGLLGSVQETLSLSTLDEPTLVAIAASGKPGILIATLLRFIYGQVPRPSDTIPLLDIWAKTWYEEPNKPQLKQLTRVWKMLRESVILEDKSAAQDYLAALDRALIEGRVWKLALAWDILEIRGALLDDQIAVVCAEYADHVSFLHDVLYEHLCVWLSKELTIETRHALVTAAEHAITKLNEAPWHPKSGEHPNPWANLLFPCIVWAHGNTTSDAAEAVFLRGLRAVFDQLPSAHEIPRTNLTKLLACLEPLLAKASPEYLATTIDHGLESHEPSVSVFCRLTVAAAKCFGSRAV